MSAFLPQKLLTATFGKFYYRHCPFMPLNEASGEAAGIHVLD
jgi:hypothetical protein